MANLKKRLEELEAQIKNAGEAPIWVDGKNSTVRVDVNRRRGGPVTFLTPSQAIAWIEKQIGAHAGGVINYHIDHICDLWENGDQLKDIIRGFIPEPVIIPRSSGRVIGGQVQPLVFDPDNLPATIGLAKIDAGIPANLRLWCLVGLIEQFFTDRAFSERWQSGQLTEKDNQMILACAVIYSWDEGELKDIGGFSRLFFQVTRLEPALRPA